jgi:hypothetical protein
MQLLMVQLLPQDLPTAAVAAVAAVVVVVTHSTAAAQQPYRLSSSVQRMAAPLP